MVVLEDSAVSLLANRRDAGGLMGLQWQPGAEQQEFDFSTQLSGLMGMTAALER